MNNQHPITPPPELLQEWCQQGRNCGSELDALKDLATQAYRAGADQELEACVKLLTLLGCSGTAAEIRAARRPKLPSLKEQALRIIDDNIEDDPAHISFALEEIKTIRRALEALDD